MNKKKLFVSTSLVLCLLLFLQRLTGEIWHGILGLLFTVIILVHLCMQSRKLKYKTFSIRCVDYMLMVSFAVVVLTGVLLHPLHGVLIINMLHKLSAVFCVLGVIVHVVQHRKGKK